MSGLDDFLTSLSRVKVSLFLEGRIRVLSLHYVVSAVKLAEACIPTYAHLVSLIENRERTE